MKSFMGWKHKICVTCMILSLFSLAGCWDNRDIEELSINVGMAMDRASNYNKIESEPPVITVTFQNVILQSAGGGQPQVSFRNISITGNLISKMAREIALTNPGPAIMHHMKVLIISEELARYMNWDNLLNDTLRSPRPRSSTYVLITKDQARNLLENKEETGSEIPSLKIFNITRNNKQSLRLLEPLSLAKVANNIAGGRSFILPCITKQDQEILFEDAAVISGKTKKLAGFINSEEITGLKWLKGTNDKGVLNMFNRQNKLLFSIQIDNKSSEIIPHVHGDQISFEVKIKSEGTLLGDWIKGSDASDERFLQKLEKEAEQKIVYQIRSLLYKLQKQYHADAADFGKALRIGYPRTYQKVKRNWDDTFTNVPIDVHVDVKIKGYNTKIKLR